MDNVSASERAARDLLAELQDAVAAKDMDRAAQVFDDDVAVFGTGSANLDREQSFVYLRNVFAQDAAIRWEWTQVRPLVDDGAVLCFAVVGTVGFDDWSEEQREPFRLTCVAVKDGARWRLRHFHGSVPQQG